MAFDVKIVNLLTLGPGIYFSEEDPDKVYVIFDDKDGRHYTEMTNPNSKDVVASIEDHEFGSGIITSVKAGGVF